MKKIMISFVLVSVLLLSSCGIFFPQEQGRENIAIQERVESLPTEQEVEQSDFPLPEWTESEALYRKTYEAFREAEWEELNVDDLILYDEMHEMPCFDFSGLSTAQQEEITQVLASVWNEQTVPLFGALGDADTVLGIFSKLEPASLELNLGYTTGSILTIADIKNLKSFYFTVGYFDIAGLPVMPELKELTVKDIGSVSGIFDKFPALKTLTFITEENIVPNDIELLAEMQSLLHLNLLNPLMEAVDVTLETVRFFRKAKEMPFILTINDTPKEQFDVQVSEEIELQIQKENVIEEIENYSEEMKQMMYDNKVYSSKGKLRVGQKVLVYIEQSSSIRDTLEDLEFVGFPLDRMATSMEEADTLILIYPYYETVGFYSNGGGSASRVSTIVTTVDIKNGNEYASYVVAKEDPPEEITIYNNIPTGGSGEFKRQEAIDYAIGLL